MRSSLTVALAALVAASASSAFASTIRAPSSLSFRAGYIAASPASGEIRTFAPSLSMTWGAGSRSAVWSSVGYIQERAEPRFRIAYGNSGVFQPRPQVFTARTHLVPVSVGLRVYPKHGERASRGPYAEFGPTVYFARYRDRANASHSAIMGGLQAGLGLRFTGLGASRGEFGVSYMLAESFGTHADAVGRIGTVDEVDYNLFSAYVAIGLGN